MYRSRNELQHLLADARRGDAGAAGRLRHELEPELQRIVRRALRTDGSRTPLSRHIRAQAHALSEDHWHPNRESLVSQVATGLADAVELRLCAAGGLKEPLRETICERR